MAPKQSDQSVWRRILRAGQTTKALLTGAACYPRIPENAQHVDEVESILSRLEGQIPACLITQDLCDLACEVCPLRAWKSPGITAVHCAQILAQARRHHRRNNIKLVFRLGG